MEKAYRHKKTGYIATQLEKDSVVYKYDCGLLPSCYIKQEMLEDSCDWEKVIHKDYEILSFRSHRNQFYNPTIQKDGTYLHAEIMEFDGNGASLEWMLNEDEYYITSVKRLSDGEVFSIGDKINFRGLYGNNSEHKYDTIRGFDLKQDANLGILYHNGLVGIEKIQKYKEVLFTTEDGVDIFEGDEVTWLYRDELKIAGTRNANENMYTDLKYFSTRESAKEYILMNKPLLSLNDLLSVWSTDGLYDVYKESPMFQNFKNLAKTKL